MTEMHPATHAIVMTHPEDTNRSTLAAQDPAVRIIDMKAQPIILKTDMAPGIAQPIIQTIEIAGISETTEVAETTEIATEDDWVVYETQHDVSNGLEKQHKQLK
jgi:hypothetical protein